MATTAKGIKVKTLADRYGMSSKEVLKELEAQGFTGIKTATSNIPADILELVEGYFDDLVAKKQKEAAAEEELEQFDDDNLEAFDKMKSRNSASSKTKKRTSSEEVFSKSKEKTKSKGQKRSDQKAGEQAAKTGSTSSPADEPREVHIKSPVVVKALAEAMGKKVNEVITQLMMMNVLASINQVIDNDVAVQLAQKMNVNLQIDKREKPEPKAEDEEQQTAPEDQIYDEDEKDLKPRPPIVTFMGHVDHGKTSLQDAIRKTHVAAGEAGGITQHIGASVVNLDGKTITFVDTPGHEAFTQMRARGANVTDIVVLVVAADDGFMPQTIEAMNHAKAAGVPIIVAINKMDLPDANADKVLLHMQQNGLMSEDWGGQTAAIRVSARTGQGLSDLLERILLEAEMLELKANPKRPALCYVLESQLEQGFGPTASVVVKNGSLRVGDPVICGEYYGKVKTLIDHRGKRIAVAPPSTPVKVVGLSGVPEAGTKLAVCSSMAEAKELAEKR